MSIELLVQIHVATLTVVGAALLGLGQADAPGVRVAVDIHAGEDLQPFRTQALRQAIGILHGIQLDESRGIGDLVGGQGQDLGADQAVDEVLHGSVPALSPGAPGHGIRRSGHGR